MKRHFLVIGGTSRVARFFIKKALLEGHVINVLCRAQTDGEALKRIYNNLLQTTLKAQHNKIEQHNFDMGSLKAHADDMHNPESYRKILINNPNIDAVVSFIGPSEKTLFNFKMNLYTSMIRALIEGMHQSRQVEFHYHSSVGNEGVPGQSKTKLPAHYSFFLNMTFSILFPVFKNLTKSENLLAKNGKMNFIIYRPDALIDTEAKRNFLSTFDYVQFGKNDFDLRQASKCISREDVAEEILRIATLPLEKRNVYFGHGLYLVDRK